MEDLIEQLKDCCVGMTAEEIASQLEGCPNVLPEQVQPLAAWLASLVA